MASRVTLPHQKKEAFPDGLKQKNAVAEGKNRRALGDIGNIVSRPITRSFCAQLIANAQKDAVAENNKKCIVVNVNGAKGADGAIPHAIGGGAKRHVQKKVTVKPPKTDEVIEISSGSEEIKKEKKQQQHTKKAVESSSSRKEAPTLTSILTARSKAACDLSRKRTEHIVDIDAADADNELAVTEYVDDMYKFYKLAESESRVHDYMPSQQEISEKMRAILIDWLVEVHYKFELNPETLYLTLNIIDRYLAVKPITRKELQLLGLGAMLIASKYEEIWAPEVNDLVNISAQAYAHKQVLAMEKRILGALEWYLTVPTPYVFLLRFIKASSVPDPSEMEHMVHFLAELAMMHYSTMIYCPSMIAASAVYAARCTLNISPYWNDTLKFHTGFSESQIMDCAKLMVNYHCMAPDHNLKVIYRKYSSIKLGAVALLPPAKFLLAAP